MWLQSICLSRKFAFFDNDIWMFDDKVSEFNRFWSYNVLLVGEFGGFLSRLDGKWAVLTCDRMSFFFVKFNFCWPVLLIPKRISLRFLFWFGIFINMEITFSVLVWHFYEYENYIFCFGFAFLLIWKMNTWEYIFWYSIVFQNSIFFFIFIFTIQNSQ